MFATNKLLYDHPRVVQPNQSASWRGVLCGITLGRKEDKEAAMPAKGSASSSPPTRFANSTQRSDCGGHPTSKGPGASATMLNVACDPDGAIAP